MEILNFFNTYIVKYLYIVVLVGLLISFICLYVKGVKPLVKTLNKVLVSVNNVNGDIEYIKSDLQKISYTLNNSLPLFVDIAYAIVIIKSIWKDYTWTIKSKRSLTRSVLKEYSNVTKKYNRKFDPQVLASILHFAKQIKK